MAERALAFKAINRETPLYLQERAGTMSGTMYPWSWSG